MSYENAWQYDAAGNRTTTTYKRATVEAPNTVATTTTIAAVFTGNDWLTSQTSTVKTAAATNATTTIYGYDQNGAQTHKRVGAAGSVEVNDWQFDGTLASTVTQGQATGGSEFVYDAAGNRLKQRTQIGKPEAKEVRYLVDPNTSYAQVVQERDENNVLQARYAWEDGLAPLVMWRRTDSGAYAAFFYLCDGQDSVRQLTDAAGKVTDSYFYDAFGNALQGGSGDTPNTFRYTGQQLDASGNYYLRARYYNSGSGRFLSHDPLMGSSSDPISMHRYLYAANDGVNFGDPSGEFTLAGALTAIGVRATVATPMAAAIGTAFNVANAISFVGSLHNIYADVSAGAEVDKLDILNVAVSGIGYGGGFAKRLFSPLFGATIAASQRLFRAGYEGLEAVQSAVIGTRGALLYGDLLINLEKTVAQYGVTIEYGTQAAVELLNARGVRGGFQWFTDGRPARILLHPDATIFEAFHEVAHAIHYGAVGGAKNFAKLSKWDKEQFVYAYMTEMIKVGKFTAEEAVEAHRYAKSIFYDAMNHVPDYIRMATGAVD